MRKARTRIGSILLAVALLVSLFSVTAFAADYKDTTGHWAEAAIDRWSEAGVVKGNGNGAFNPNGNMTRAEAAQTFVNLLKLDGKADLSAYTDVPADAWYANALAACVDGGIMNGTSDTTMNPNGTITREMFFVMFGRALGLPEETTLKVSFADSGSISNWAKGYVYALVNNGYVAGTSATNLSPLNAINRASVMSLLDQTIVSYVVNDGTTNVTEKGVVLVLADNATITGSAAATITVASAGAKVSLKGYNGTATVIAKESNIQITNAPAGTVIVVAEGATGVTVNGTAVSADSKYTVPGATSSGGSSSGGGNTDEDDSRPNIVIGDKIYQWDPDEKEYVTGDGDEKEYISEEDMKEMIENSSPDAPIIVDGKEYYYDAEEGEWFEILDKDETEMVDPDHMEDVIGGSNTMNPVS